MIAINTNIETDKQIILITDRHTYTKLCKIDTQPQINRQTHAHINREKKRQKERKREILREVLEIGELEKDIYFIQNFLTLDNMKCK